MANAKLSVTQAALNQKEKEFPSFQEGMFHDMDIRRNYQRHTKEMDERTEELFQDVSLYVIFFREEDDNALSAIKVLEETGAKHIYIEIEETNLYDSYLCQCINPYIYGEFDRGKVCFNKGSDEYAFFYPNEGNSYGGLWNSDGNGINDDRRYSIQKFLNGPDWEPDLK